MADQGNPTERKIIGVMLFQSNAVVDGMTSADPNFQVVTIHNDGEADYKAFPPSDYTGAVSHMKDVMASEPRLRSVIENAAAFDTYFFKDAQAHGSSIIINMHHIPMIIVQGNAYPRAFSYNGCSSTEEAEDMARRMRERVNQLQLKPLAGDAPVIAPSTVTRLFPPRKP